MIEPPTEEQLRQLRRVVKHARALGVASVGGVRTDTLVWLLERAGAWSPPEATRPATAAKG